MNNRKLRKNEIHFFDVNKNVLDEDFVIELKFEIDLVPFGKREFDNQNERKIFLLNKKFNNNKKIERYLDDEGNIFFLLSGK